MPRIPRPDVQIDPGVIQDAMGGVVDEAGDRIQHLLEEHQERQAELERLQERVDRVVVLMMENRSFDHLLGWLGPEGGGLTGNESNPGPTAAVAPDESPVARPVFQTTDTALDFDPPHGLYRVVRDQVNDGAMDGFVNEFARKKESLKKKVRFREWRDANVATPMAYYGPSTLPTYRFLVEQHQVCARYFASAQSGTWVNRMFLYAGTSGGLADNPNNVVVRGDDYQKHMPTRLLVDLLEENGVSWGIYADGVAWMRLFRQDNLPEARVHDFRRHFADHCRNGTLPKVVFVDPNPAEGFEFRGNDDHVPVDLLNGQAFVRDVYEGLRLLQAGEKTVLVVTYDEHGGFYDHMAPPPVKGFVPEPYYATTGDGHPLHDNPFRNYGVRVPCFVVSRYAPAGQVVTDDDLVLDHVSLHASIHRRFLGEDVPFLSTRVEAAQTLGRLLTLEAPRPPLPPMPAPVARSAVRAAPPARRLPPRPVEPDDVDRDESARASLLALAQQGRGTPPAPKR